MKEKLAKLFKPAEAARLYETFGYLSGIKHGNPLYSELAFPGRSRAGHIVIATGPIEDRFAKKFSDVLRAYSIYQVAWSAQVFSHLISKYALMDPARRVRVHSNFKALTHLESDFRRFFRHKLSARNTFFGIKSMMMPVKLRVSGNGKKKSTR
jgi:hypothetical protein